MRGQGGLEDKYRICTVLYSQNNCDYIFLMLFWTAVDFHQTHVKANSSVMISNTR